MSETNVDNITYRRTSVQEAIHRINEGDLTPEQCMQRFEDKAENQAHLADIAAVRSTLREQRTVGSIVSSSGMSNSKRMRMKGSIPPEVWGFIQQFYKPECQKKEFWDWFFKKYPKYLVSERIG